MGVRAVSGGPVVGSQVAREDEGLDSLSLLKLKSDVPSEPVPQPQPMNQTNNPRLLLDGVWRRTR